MNENVAQAFSAAMNEAMAIKEWSDEDLYDAIFDVPDIQYCMIDLHRYIDGTDLPQLDLALAIASVLNIDMNHVMEQSNL